MKYSAVSPLSENVDSQANLLRVISAEAVSEKTVKAVLSDGTRLKISAETAELFGIKNGAVLSDDIEEILHDSEIRRAKSTALNVLSYNNRSSSKLRERLLKDYPEDIVDEIMPDLISAGLVNDSEYAYTYAYDCVRVKLWGNMRISRELRLRGIDDDTIEEAIALASEDGFSEEERLEILVENKYITRIYDEKSRKRAFDAILRLGYRFGDVRNALNIIEETD